MPRRPGGHPRGKLKALARAWATGRGGGEGETEGDPLTAAASAELGRRATRRRDEGREIEIAPDEVDAVGLFLSLATQWRRAGLEGVRTGLDYGVVRETAAMMGLTFRPSLLLDLRMMEAAALAAWGERR